MAGCKTLYNAGDPSGRPGDQASQERGDAQRQDDGGNRGAGDQPDGGIHGLHTFGLRFRPFRAESLFD